MIPLMIETAVYGALVGIWWILSATLLLPFIFLLKYSKSFSDIWFAFIYTACMKVILGRLLLPLRRQAFDLLKENLTGRDASNALRVLEIGIGTGDNLQFYPENSHLTALDMNINFVPQFRLSQKKNKQVVYERTVIAFAEDMEGIDDCSMDVVISTYVLCSVKSVKATLKEVKRVLKPGGKFLFLEHVRYPKSYWNSIVQQLANPLWNIYTDGCSLTKDIESDIKNAGFSDVTCRRIFPESLILFVRPEIYGIATK